MRALNTIRNLKGADHDQDVGIASIQTSTSSIRSTIGFRMY